MSQLQRRFFFLKKSTLLITKHGVFFSKNLTTRPSTSAQAYIAFFCRSVHEPTTLSQDQKKRHQTSEWGETTDECREGTRVSSLFCLPLTMLISPSTPNQIASRKLQNFCLQPFPTCCIQLRNAHSCFSRDSPENLALFSSAIAIVVSPSLLRLPCAHAREPVLSLQYERTLFED
jgi:hypothetical protein